jgi:hypothetical protein
MKRQLAKLLILVGLVFGGVAKAADAPPLGGVYATEGANGSIELSNTSTTDNQVPVVVAPGAAVATPADAQAAAADAPKDPREQYRDNILTGEQAPSGPTLSVSRRYKMMDKATYQATIIGTTPQVQKVDPKAQ